MHINFFFFFGSPRWGFKPPKPPPPRSVTEPILLRSLFHVKARFVRATKVNFREMELDVAISWQLRCLHGIYAVRGSYGTDLRVSVTAAKDVLCACMQSVRKHWQTYPYSEGVHDHGKLCLSGPYK